MEALVASLSARLSESLQAGADDSEVERLARRLELALPLVRDHRRRRSLLWGTIAIAIAIGAASLLNVLRLRRVDVVLSSTARAFVLTNGSETSNILPVSVPLTKVTIPGNAPKCTKPELHRAGTCDPVSGLRLNTVFVNPSAVVGMRILEECIELDVLSGAASVDLTVFRDGSGSGADSAVEASHADLQAGASIRLCPAAELVLRANGLSGLLLGDRDAGSGIAERETFPSLLSGTLAIVDTAEELPLQRTDVVRFGEMSSGSLVARARESIEIVFVGHRTGSLVRGTGNDADTLMPSALDWLQRSPRLKAALLLIAAIVGAAIAVRRYWLDEAR
ncbi:MAG TPA: hypothetical protein VGR62_16165 [Candidatus Binatia bacterium]|nr:hypothetical protein [Candidatus Binatia bacterium]